MQQIRPVIVSSPKSRPRNNAIIGDSLLD